MSSLPLKVLASIVVATFARASPADAAKKSKHKKVAASSTTTRTNSQHRGIDLVPAGPLYFSGVIRFQLLRDISGRLGGDD
jgi:hypothetical protein